MVAAYFLLLVCMMVAAFGLAQLRARTVAGGRLSSLHSLPSYHGMLAAAAVLLPMLLIYLVGAPLVGWLAETRAIGQLPAALTADDLQRGAAMRDIVNLAAGQHTGVASAELQSAAKIFSATSQGGILMVLAAGVLVALAAFGWIWRQISIPYRARNRFERVVTVVLMACAAVAVLTTFGIVLSVLGETYRFFFDPAITGKPTVAEFLFGTNWSPQSAMRADQGSEAGSFGFIPLLVGTLLITTIAILVAGPLGLMSAIYLSEYAGPRFRAIVKPLLEILAGIPTVVLGFFAALTVAPFIRGWGQSIGLDVASESALAAGLVMGMMIIPFISSLSDDVINAVPQSMRDGSYGLGATKSETIRKVVLPAALPGIVSAFMLAISRAIGETMIVVMAAGLAANLTFNPLAAVTTITVQIATILVGDQEFNSAKTLAAFALGFALFFITLLLNFIALRVVHRYRERYV
jgi:phosphate transport system permease protein